MDFAKKLLNKYGWNEGQGLGKNNDGIVKPLKASMKFDVAGLGVDAAASDFNNHWWERVFNDAANNVDVKQQEDGIVSMELKESDALEITTNSYSLKKLKKAKANNGDNRYGNFIKVATLTKSGNVIENPEKIDTCDLEVKKYKVLTDEELFKACGGRTAHKGARHGLKLSGKLSRLEQQEKEMLLKLQDRQSAKDEVVDIPKTKSKKCKNKQKENSEGITSELPDSDELEPKKKKKKSKDKEIAQEEAMESETTVQASKSKKKKKRKVEEEKDIEQIENPKKKKKKKDKK